MILLTFHFLSQFLNVPVWLIIVVIVVLILLPIILLPYGVKLYLYLKSDEKETWLSVVDDTGNVIGRVAKSVSMEEPGKYQHPLIRILIWHKGKLYLRHRTRNVCFEKGLVDHPFEQLIPYGATVDDVLMKVRCNYFPDSEKPRFLLKYKHENKEGKWLVLLYLIILPDENQLKQLQTESGKLWTLKQIKENRNMGYFSNIFEGEFGFFNTLLYTK